MVRDLDISGDWDKMLLWQTYHSHSRPCPHPHPSLALSTAPSLAPSHGKLSRVPLTRTRTFTLNVVLTLTPPLTLTFPVTLVPTSLSLSLSLPACSGSESLTHSHCLCLSNSSVFCALSLSLPRSLRVSLSLSLFPLFLTLLLPPREAKVPRKNPNVYEALNWRRLFRTDYWGLDMFEAGLSCTGRSFFESDSSFSAVFVCGMIALVRTRGRRLRIRQLGRVLGPISPSDL